MPRDISEPVRRNFEVAVAIAFGLRKTTAAQVHLQRIEHLFRQAERRIARLTEPNVVVLRGATGQVRVFLPLFADRALPGGLCSILRTVIVSDKNAMSVRMVEDFGKLVEELACRSTGKVATCGSGIGMHQGVVGEDRVADHVGDRTERVTWREYHPRL